MNGAHHQQQYPLHEGYRDREGSVAWDHSVSASVRNCQETHYTVVTVWCRDRPKLFFDTVCVITDLGYLIHHAVVQQEEEGMASQEYFVRTMAGTPLSPPQQLALSDAIQSAVVLRCPQVRASDAHVHKGLRYSESDAHVQIADVQ